ncbi:MAG: riboflavin synthase [Pyrinomonadaceae bacterium]
MFTGLIEKRGKIAAMDRSPDGALIRIETDLVSEGTDSGDSIAVNGVCLTALDIDNTGFSADVSNETLRRSTLGDLEIGSAVNLERAVTPTTRLGGHIVQGHVDCRGTFLGAVREGEFHTVTIGFPEEFGRYLVYKGSVAVEGISLTVAKLNECDFEIALIPKTWECTNLSELVHGDSVNLEADVVAKYVERMMQAGGTKGFSG